jgi:hypothetical protein
MPQIADIIINDGAATPVAHTFKPIGKDANGVFWWEQSTPAPVNKLGAKRIGYKQTRELAAQNQLTALSKASYMLFVPTLETLGNNSAGITPPATVAYREIARVEYTIAERSVAQERKDTRVLSLNLLGHAMAVANIDNLEPSYA